MRKNLLFLPLAYFVEEKMLGYLLKFDPQIFVKHFLDVEFFVKIF